MEVGINGKHIQLNPELEAMRNKVLLESAARKDEFLLQIIRKTSRIHAGFLWEMARETLKNLCLRISETPNKITDAGWMEFGVRLGLDIALLHCIDNCFNDEDPTYYTLVAFVQKDDATIGKIIKALWDMQRLDVITRIKDPINELADKVLQYRCNVGNVNSTESTSDYESLPPSEGSTTSSNSNIEITVEEIIRPRPEVIPRAPFIFQNVQDQIMRHGNQNYNNDSANCYESFTSENSSTSNEGGYIEAAQDRFHGRDREYESLQSSEVKFKNYGIKSAKEPKKKHGKIIMLTFASDGEKIVKEICQIFRREREKYPSIGVLVLSEHLDIVNKDPHRFISGAFHQVDYVIPILTNQYFKIISGKENPPTSNLHIDASYVQYIYSLMNSYYISNGCLNDKIRCIIPDHLVSSIQCNLLMAAPIFSAWVKFSEAEDLAIRLLKSKT